MVERLEDIRRAGDGALRRVAAAALELRRRGIMDEPMGEAIDWLCDELNNMGTTIPPMPPKTAKVTTLRLCNHCGGEGWYRPLDPAGNAPSERCPYCNTAAVAEQTPAAELIASDNSIEEWSWTWVRYKDGPVFPMRGNNPNVKGGYSIHSPVMHPDEVLALKAKIFKLWTALDDLIGDEYRGFADGSHNDKSIRARACVVRDETCNKD